MLDVRPTRYVVPLLEQDFASLTPLVRIDNYGTVGAQITGQVHIYRRSTGLRIYTSALTETWIGTDEFEEVAALTPWSPPAPINNDYFIMCNITAVATEPHEPPEAISQLGPFDIDIKPVGMGPSPAAHAPTHEDGGSDPLYVENQPTTETDATLVLAPDGAGGVEFRAEAGGGGTLSETPQTLTDQAYIDWDLALGGAAEVTLAGDRTMNAPTHMVDGSRPRLKVIQDGTGTRLITWDAVYRFPAGVDPCLSAAPNNIDILIFDCDGTHLDCVSMVNALA